MAQQFIRPALSPGSIFKYVCISAFLSIRLTTHSGRGPQVVFIFFFAFPLGVARSCHHVVKEQKMRSFLNGFSTYCSLPEWGGSECQPALQGEVQGRRKNQDAGDSTIIWGSGLCEFYLLAGILMVLLIFFYLHEALSPNHKITHDHPPLEEDWTYVWWWFYSGTKYNKV